MLMHCGLTRDLSKAKGFDGGGFILSYFAAQQPNAMWRCGCKLAAFVFLGPGVQLSSGKYESLKPHSQASSLGMRLESLWLLELLALILHLLFMMS